MIDKNQKSNVFYRGPLKKRYPIIKRGEGIYLFDEQGNRYIDAVGGPAVVNVGYGVEEILEGIIRQGRELSHISTIQFTTKVQEEFARKLADISPEGMNKIWISLSGTEANETAIKLARQYHTETGNPSKYKVIGTWNSYHGHTLGSLSISGRTAWRKPYTPYLFDVQRIFPAYCYRCHYGKEYPECGIFCAHQLEKLIKQEGQEYISALVMETIVTGSSGVLVPPPEYFKIIRSICDRYNIIMILDEVFTGIGRTGKTFAIDHWNIVPDIITAAKGIAGGFFPVGATIIKESIYDVIYEGTGQFVHGVTFSGHPIGCAAGLATLNYLEDNGLIERCAKMGDYFLQKLSSLNECPIVGDIRGKGLLAGIEFVMDRESKMPFERQQNVSKRVAEKAFQRRLNILPGFGGIDGILGDHIILTPPFIIREDEADEIVKILHEILQEVQEGFP
jgi:adenosylmethionine-8-amino-7-oxononanoate aminotransferase